MEAVTIRRKILAFTTSWLLAVSCFGQENLLQLFSGNDWMADELLRYDSVKFQWNMRGEIQAELNDGINYLAEENAGSSIGAFERVITMDSGLWVAYYYRGVAYKSMQNFADAESDFKKARALKPDEAAILVELGKTKQLSRDFISARQYYQQAAQLAPVRGAYFLGALSYAEGQSKDAQRYLQVCIDADPKQPEYFARLGQVQTQLDSNSAEGISNFDRALKLNPNFLPALVNRGLINAETNTEASLKDFNVLVRLRPGNVNFKLIRGCLYTFQGDFDRAFLDFHKAIQETSESENKFRGAQSLLDKKLDIQYAGYYTIINIYGLPEKTATLIKRAFCLLLVGKNARAMQIFDRCMSMDNTALTPFLNAVAHEHSGLHEYAYRLYEEALKRDNDIFDAHKKRGVYRSELRQWDDAIFDFNEMLRINPKGIVANKFRGIAYYHQNQFLQAKDDFTTFINGDTTDFEVFGFRAMCWKALGDRDAAAKDLMVVSRGEEIEFRQLENLVHSALLSGDTVNIEMNLKRLIRSSPTNPIPRILKIRVSEAKRDWDTMQQEMRNTYSLMSQWVRIGPAYSYFYLAYARLQIHRNETAEAILSLNESIAMDSKNADAYLERAKILLKKRKNKQAKEDLVTAKSLGSREAEELLKKAD